jgi:signal transduction histidine kinase
MKSLQGRLMAVLVATITLCWAGAITVLLVFTQDNQTSIWDSKLQAIGTKILMSIPSSGELRSVGPRLQLREDTLRRNNDPAFNDQMRDEHLTFQVWSRRTEMAVRAPGAPATALQPSFEEGVSTQVVDGQRWRVYSISDSTGRITVQVANLHGVIDAELRRKAFIALGIMTVLLVLVGALMAFAVWKSLAPVAAVEAALRKRNSLDLTPLPAIALPSELRPMVESFNHLLGQLSDAVEGERRFIGDAAHELRTPLSALSAQAQVALRAGTLEEKDAALRKLQAVAERSTRLSEQLLDLARLNAGAHSPRHAPTQPAADLDALVRHVANEFEVVAEQRDRHIVLATEPCRIACDVDEIGILLRNLLDNALRYTEAGGTVCIGCGTREAGGAQQVFLEVADDGPGVPEAEREAIFKRFHRLAGSGGRGSGIGLSLVAGIAELHGARIETCDGLQGRGFCVRIVFPVPHPEGWQTS